MTMRSTGVWWLHEIIRVKIDAKNAGMMVLTICFTGVFMVNEFFDELSDKDMKIIEFLAQSMRKPRHRPRHDGG